MFWRNTKKPQREGHTIDAGPANDVPTDSGVTIQLKQDKELALFNVDGQFYAIENFCTHRGAPLADGELCEGPTVECAWHGWRFDLRTGQCLDNNTKLETYAVTVEDGTLKISV